jgi:hypothetical protein
VVRGCVAPGGGDQLPHAGFDVRRRFGLSGAGQFGEQVVQIAGRVVIRGDDDLVVIAQSLGVGGLLGERLLPLPPGRSRRRAVFVGSAAVGGGLHQIAPRHARCVGGREAGTSRSPTVILKVVVPAVRVSGRRSSPVAGSSLASDVCSAFAVAVVRFWLVAG